ncbi:putative ABC transport system ATP-binding protein [Motilibacter peucedani]|uniref:Putative ABC transport system ATP-binding protein n=1 Tax=Motilibacter peucedani TaxID=598650 RepID=A0A420XQN9_9ACTN|nr:ATP-binding cassette domain-containing protein [Motilibacter peucedani]RKS75522.1 putative ABC transport system ATP-binding protein [Motilibacter peucedani]
MSAAPVLVVRAVSHVAGAGRHAVPVLTDVSVVAHRGELVALAGRSGSGKTTLCHLVAGAMRPGSGEVLVEGRPADSIDDWAVRAFLPQRLGLAEELTVEENAHLPARLRGATPDAGLLARLALDAIAAQPAVQTSLGEQQRTGLARALCLRPGLLVLDEPTGHQDDANVDRVLGELQRAAATGTTVLAATHDPRVIAVASRVVRLEGGRVDG